MKCTKLFLVSQFSVFDAGMQSANWTRPDIFDEARLQIRSSEYTRTTTDSPADHNMYNRHLRAMLNGFVRFPYFSDEMLGHTRAKYDALLAEMDECFAFPVSSKDDWDRLDARILNFYRRYNVLNESLIFWRMLDYEIKHGNPPALAMDGRKVQNCVFNKMIQGLPEAYDEINRIVIKQETCWRGALRLDEHLRSLESLVKSPICCLALKVSNAILRITKAKDEQDELEELE